MPATINLEEDDIDIILEWYETHKEIQGRVKGKELKLAGKLKNYKDALISLNGAFATGS